MNPLLPREYVVQKFYQYVKKPTYNRASDNYQGSCCLCSDSVGKKRRCYYLPKKDLIYCFNCSYSHRPIKWIQEVTKDTREEILKEAESFDILPTDFFTESKTPKKEKVPSLPHDSINLFDPFQVKYYKDNAVVRDALRLIKHRRIDTAVNRPQTLWVSLTDIIHKERLIIPFYDITDDIIFYQSRTIYEKEDTAKYLSKSGGDRSLYNINHICSDIEYIFVCEGPIDAFFIQNGTCTCGISEGDGAMFTALQQRQRNMFKFHKVVWVFDSQYCDKTSNQKTKKLLDAGESVFIWPEELGQKYKDINEYCIDNALNEFDLQMILANTFSGKDAKIRVPKLCSV